MKVYVMRHGKTNWNENGTIQGRSHNRLSNNGKAVVEEVALKQKDTKFDIIFCSPLMRTIQTANIMNQYHNVKILKDERLIEIDQGIFTKRKKSTLSDVEKQQRENRDISCGMEKYEEVYERTKDFLNYLKKQKYESVLVVTHNINASLMAGIFDNISIDFKNDKHIRNFKNADIREFNLDT